MKKMLLATALALLITGCAQQTFAVQNKPAAVAPKKKNHHPSFLRFTGIGQKKTVDAAKFVAAQKMLLKRNQQTFVNAFNSGLLLLKRYTPLEAGNVCSLTIA